MERVELRTDPPASRDVYCWHRGRAVAAMRAARYLYLGDRPRTAIVEDWHPCPCGAYENIRRPTEIVVSHLDPR
jgi:hypothetical protein